MQNVASSSTMERTHLLSDLNELPLLQEVDSDNIDDDVPENNDMDENVDVYEEVDVENALIDNEDYWDIGDPIFEYVHCDGYFCRGDSINRNHTEIVQDLKQMFDDQNVLTKSFRMVRDRFQKDSHTNVRLKLIGKRNYDGRRYNLPIVSEVAALVIGDFEVSRCDRDIVVKTQSGLLQRINRLNASYLALQYSLLFLYGEDGYREDIVLNKKDESSRGRKFISMRDFFSYKIQERNDEIPIIVNSKRLFQQFLVDAFTMIESSRLKYIRTHQKQLRVAMYKGLEDAVLQGEIDPSSHGKRVILSSSFTAGARYMIQNYQNAMTICK
ncbi:hypothetical protein T459_17695 [Capsicum annuum]|uniref:Helitron helicase-like domain-containing protein n=1 Tax=Capsicum annuum TaxID=4072 RepID=A0A2G2ZCA7_CAPAN|nr:hypothetical protein T459_17695 [Capsicum annuum]